MGCLKLTYKKELPILKVVHNNLNISSYNYAGEYRYGFNGLEKDDEVMGGGNSYTTFFRQYDPRLGRWLSIDPLARKYPSMSPYSFAANSPLIVVDKDGRDLIVIGNEAEFNKFKAKLEAAFNGYIVISRDKNNKVTMSLSDKYKEADLLTTINTALSRKSVTAAMLYMVTIHPEDTKIRLLESDKDKQATTVGNFRGGNVGYAEGGYNYDYQTLDMDDVDAMDGIVNNGQAAVIHEISEAFYDQVLTGGRMVKGGTEDDKYDQWYSFYEEADNFALGMEAFFLGAKEVAPFGIDINDDLQIGSGENGILATFEDKDGNKSYVFSVVTTDANGQINGVKEYNVIGFREDSNGNFDWDKIEERK